jgi:hypothetical protein
VLLQNADVCNDCSAAVGDAVSFPRRIPSETKNGEADSFPYSFVNAGECACIEVFRQGHLLAESISMELEKKRGDINDK